MTTATSPTYNARHSHGLGREAAYVVRQTIVDGVVLTAGFASRVDAGIEPVARFECRQGPGFDPAYTSALEAVHGLRGEGSWAVIDTVYECGCDSGAAS